MINVPNDAERAVLSFVRQDDASKVFAVLNLSPFAREVSCRESLCHGTYRDLLSGTEVMVGNGTSLALPAWGHGPLLA